MKEEKILDFFGLVKITEKKHLKKLDLRGTEAKIERVKKEC